MNKKLMLLLLTAASAVAVSAAEINEEYGYGYDAIKSSRSRGGEHSLFEYKDGTIAFFRNDTIYLTRYDAEQEDLKRPVVCFDFEKLNLTGKAAYDKTTNRLFYTAYDRKLKGDFLYVSSVGEDGKWAPGEKVKIKGTTAKKSTLGYIRNAGYAYAPEYLKGFYNPEISDDGKRLYFSASFDNKTRDIYYSDLIDEENQIWSYPTALGAINSGSNDEDYVMADTENGTVYVSRKDRKTFQQLMVREEGDSSNSAYSLATPMEEVFNEGSSYNVVMAGNMPVFLSNRDGGKDSQLYLFRMNYEGKKKSFYWVFFRFAFDDATLDGMYYTDVDALAYELLQFPGERFEITGYSDTRGTDEYNMELSLKRANTIRDMLIERGLTPESLVAVGKGKDAEGLKVKDAKTEGEHAQNRRVEVRVIMNR